jgi:gas vesicle protein
MSKDSNKGLALGAAIGAVVGVVTGILFAPKSGKETRQDIKDTAVKVAAKLQEEAKHLQEELSHLIEKAEEKAKEAGKTVSEKTHELIAQAKHTRDSLTKLALAVKNGEASDKDLDKAINKAKEAKEALAVYLKK